MKILLVFTFFILSTAEILFPTCHPEIVYTRGASEETCSRSINIQHRKIDSYCQQFGKYRFDATPKILCHLTRSHDHHGPKCECSVSLPCEGLKPNISRDCDIVFACNTQIQEKNGYTKTNLVYMNETSGDILTVFGHCPKGKVIDPNEPDCCSCGRMPIGLPACHRRVCDSDENGVFGWHLRPICLPNSMIGCQCLYVNRTCSWVCPTKETDEPLTMMTWDYESCDCDCENEVCDCECIDECECGSEMCDCGNDMCECRGHDCSCDPKHGIRKTTHRVHDTKHLHRNDHGHGETYSDWTRLRDYLNPHDFIRAFNASSEKVKRGYLQSPFRNVMCLKKEGKVVQRISRNVYLKRIEIADSRCQLHLHARAIGYFVGCPRVLKGFVHVFNSSYAEDVFTDRGIMYTICLYRDYYDIPSRFF